jgi:CHRD domain
MRKVAVMLLLSVTFLPGLSQADTSRDDSSRRVKAERLVGGNENPPVVSEGSGMFKGWFRHDGIAFQLRYDVASEASDLAPEGSDVTQAHLHIANPGTNGGITVFLCTNLGNTPMGATARDCPPSPGVVTGTIVMNDVQTVTAGEPPDETTIIEAGDLEGLSRLIKQGAVYANVHTDAHSGGEVRGQLNPRPR